MSWYRKNKTPIQPLGHFSSVLTHAGQTGTKTGICVDGPDENNQRPALLKSNSHPLPNVSPSSGRSGESQTKQTSRSARPAVCPNPFGAAIWKTGFNPGSSPAERVDPRAELHAHTRRDRSARRFKGPVQTSPTVSSRTHNSLSRGDNKKTRPAPSRFTGATIRSRDGTGYPRPARPSQPVTGPVHMAVPPVLFKCVRARSPADLLLPTQS
ncbi:translation initiation factor IF-2 [Anopheles sinensis]|uniref:Translation initiation factor IF-2 n=1 Tax=Anopheles sinensis TaxID=74873 RepID=A0A084WKM5_ANOSI|nr:translation initiation factor IF-2 [Anopheles sinensis]